MSIQLTGQQNGPALTLKVYLAGPMTGIPDLNFPEFNRVTAALRAAGHIVVNPVEVNGDPNAAWTDCMRADIRELVTCQAIALLPGWQASKGAKLEFKIATALAMPAFDAHELAGDALEAV